MQHFLETLFSDLGERYIELRFIAPKWAKVRPTVMTRFATSIDEATDLIIKELANPLSGPYDM